MKDLDLTTLRLFVQVCDTRSILRVSEREQVVPSAITKRLAKLEHDLGVKLLRRGQGGVIPTSAGLALAASARHVIEESRRLHNAIALHKAGASGFVPVMASYASTCAHLVDDLESFMNDAQFRDTRIALSQGVTAEVVLAVREGRAALGIVWDVVELGGLTTLPYGTDQLVLCLRPEHPLAQRTTVSPEDIFQQDYISYPWAQTFIETLKQASALDHDFPPPRLTVPTYEAAVRYAAAGLGVCVLPLAMAHPLATSLKLKLLAIDAGWSLRHYALCFRDQASLTPVTRQLIDHLSRRSRQRHVRSAEPGV
ncbi:MAG: hypothetical protein RL322_2674 [Pseudomonadota bacterium]